MSMMLNMYNQSYLCSEVKGHAPLRHQ